MSGVSILDLGCEMGASPTANNAALISDAFSSSFHNGSLYIPSGILRTSQKIHIPGTCGHGLLGQGPTEANNDSSSRHGKSSRIIAEFAGSDGVVVQMDSGYSRLKDLHIQGRPVPPGGESGIEPPDEDTPQAAIGIHIPPQNIASFPTSKSVIDNVSIAQCNTGILLGRDLEDIGTWPFTGYDDLHADEVEIGTLHFHGHIGSSTHLNTGRAVHIRALQSVCHYFRRIDSHGAPEDVVYVEAGSAVVIGQLLSIGAGTTIALHLGMIDGSTSGQIYVGQVFLDGAGAGQRVLKMDPVINFSMPNIVFGQCQIGAAITAVPQFDCQPGQIVINNASVLKAGSIKLTGQESGGQKLVCHVILNNCKIAPGVTPATLIDAASSGAYCLTWRNCVISEDGGSPVRWGRPITDGEILNDCTRLSL